MKKIYEAPEVEKVNFCYKEQVTASNGAAASTGIKGGPANKFCYDRNIRAMGQGACEIFD